MNSDRHTLQQQNEGSLDTGPLGLVSEQPTTYTPSLLHAIPRADSRAALNLNVDDVYGEDLWTGYEFSWLSTEGKPQVAGVRLRVPSQSAAIVESKSLKLYLNSYAMTRFETQAAVLSTLDQDLALAFRAPVLVELVPVNLLDAPINQLPGQCLDHLDVRIKDYQRDPLLLEVEDIDRVVREVVYTDLFRSLCPVTGQPDFASIAIDYAGPAISRESLLRYLVSFRNHQAFHESTIEQIYCDLRRRCQPQSLTVYGRFLRRGGLDINPYRSSSADPAPMLRLSRQ
ncbi:MAG: NADPH-dependent 7-cyano-7-deazaguanine reductase QueF [Pseudomonadota bacterium]